MNTNEIKDIAQMAQVDEKIVAHLFERGYSVAAHWKSSFFKTEDGKHFVSFHWDGLSDQPDSVYLNHGREGSQSTIPVTLDAHYNVSVLLPYDIENAIALLKGVQSLREEMKKLGFEFRISGDVDEICDSFEVHSREYQPFYEAFTQLTEFRAQAFSALNTEAAR